MAAMCDARCWMLTLRAGFRGMLGGARLDELDNIESNAKAN